VTGAAWSRLGGGYIADARRQCLSLQCPSQDLLQQLDQRVRGRPPAESHIYGVRACDPAVHGIGDDSGHCVPPAGHTTSGWLTISLISTHQDRAPLGCCEGIDRGDELTRYPLAAPVVGLAPAQTIGARIRRSRLCALGHRGVSDALRSTAIRDWLCRPNHLVPLTEALVVLHVGQRQPRKGHALLERAMGAPCRSSLASANAAGRPRIGKMASGPNWAVDAGIGDRVGSPAHLTTSATCIHARAERGVDGQPLRQGAS